MNIRSSKLETIVNVLVLVAAVAAIANITMAMFGFSKGASASPSAAQFRSGDKLVGADALGLEGAPQTLILYTSSLCHFCSESMPFYQSLVAHARSKRFAVVGITAEDPTINNNYLTEHGVKPDRVLSAASSGMRFRGTPTLMLVSKSKVVIGFWQGKLSAKNQARVIEAVDVGQRGLFGWGR